MLLKGKAHKYGSNINTDEIIPARFLNTSDPFELAKHCMEDLDKDFVNKLSAGDFIVAEDNFGCGSSREHAPWALFDYGFRAIIAPSFADIFYNNCVKNGILLVRLETRVIDELFRQVEQKPGVTITAGLEKQVVIGPDGKECPFDINSFAKACLLKGLDQIGWTQQFEDRIVSFEKKRSKEKPWMA